MTDLIKPLNLRTRMLAVGLLLALLAVGMGIRLAAARETGAPTEAISPLHPTFALLDPEGINVLESAGPVSTMQTCGQCHDTLFIVEHSYHADLGLSDILTGTQVEGQAWDSSTGRYGQWDPLTYRYLSGSGDERFDLGTPEWVMLFGARHVGGGPATTSRIGVPLVDLFVQASNPDSAVLDPETGLPVAWDWEASGVIEMNCFLCHMAAPDNAARTAEIEAGNFAWANTATLNGMGLLNQDGVGVYAWNPAAFDGEGELLQEYVAIQDPTNANCAQCHGVVHTDANVLILPVCGDLSYPQTATTGQVIGPGRILNSGVNLSNKEELAFAWDIHAERQVQCTDCHYSLNNPVFYQASAVNRPAHLLFDPRRLEIGEYLERPDHNFARGQSAQFNVAPDLKGTMRRCDSCHEAVDTHAGWLPYAARHMATVACETCHIPQLYAPAIRSYDWTVLTADDQPLTSCRGVEGAGDPVTDLVTGFQPVLLQRTNVDGDTLLAPYNLITAWFWVYEDAHGNTRPVRIVDLEAAWRPDGAYPSEVLVAFDANGDGRLSEAELVIDTPEKEALIAGRLEAIGLRDPRIVGEVYPYSINHNVVGGEQALDDCETCHSADSRLAQPIILAGYAPGGVAPEFVADTNVPLAGEVYADDDGALYYQPDPQAESRYIFGHSNVAWVDRVGGLLFVGVLIAVGGHSGLRAWNAMRMKDAVKARFKRTYMYQAYERIWHWLQTVVIVLLLFTGLVIHRPELFGIFSFAGMVVMHNVLAVLLAINAFLSLFYHLASGEIKQFIPRPRGFFDNAIVQAKYYLGGIFRRAPHPFEKTPERRMNPLQQMTYLVILNVLLPLQGLTGILMWGVQKWPQYARFLGGLPGLAPFHTLIAWTFAAFIVAHVYLTTTGGPQPLDSIKAMVTGWEEIEVHEVPEEEKKPVRKPKTEEKK
ncbi:MAG: cytochrome b/b6 domain-containing protein [Anaerolineales bacterium]|nr:cytochrome b/b6 domain-containing protein [Anaerolineales bacterium]